MVKSGVGLTVNEVARRYRVGRSRVLGWIARGELKAVNVRDPGCGKPCLIVTPEALEAFEMKRGGAEVKTPRVRKKRRWTMNFFAGGERRAD